MNESVAEVMRTGAQPRVQLRLCDWLNRTPASAERLVVETHEQVILDLEVAEAIQRGPDRLAEQIYISAMEVAHACERETRFSCTWYKTGAQGEAVTALHTSFRLGSNVRDGDHYDGSAVSIISQLQSHQHDMLRTFMSAIGSITQNQAAMIGDMRAALSHAQEQMLELRKENAELVAENAELDSGGAGDDETNQLVQLGMEAIAKQMGAAKKQ